MEETSFSSFLNIKGTLSYNKLQNGMVILGCVRHITNFSLEVELPGLCFASVNIVQISDPFIKRLNNLVETNDSEASNILSNMFSIGEFLLVKITSIENRETGMHIEGSINPKDIYDDHNFDSFNKGMLIWSCINSETDHGYEMSLGVKHCRAFLPFKNVDDNFRCEIGKPFWCIIHKADINESSSILRVSAKSKQINEHPQDIDNLHNVIPRMKVELIIEKITIHGIHGKFSEKFIGFIDKNHLSKPLKKLSDYQEGKVIMAYVLFIEPATNIVHLTLRNLDETDKAFHNIGDIVRAEVFINSNNGIYFVLPNKNKGFATNKRLLNTLSKRVDTDINKAINSKFPIGSIHTLRIMDYNHLSQTYICSPEFSVVKETSFQPKDLKAGQLVKVTVIEVKEEGLVVKCGLVRGFVPNIHISNSEYSSNVKAKYKPQYQQEARVLSVENDKVLFTFKPALVKNDKCLCQTEDAVVGEKYPGVVVKITENGALIVFYNNIKGWISLKGMGTQSTDPTKYFFVGQVANVYIWRKSGTFIHLSLFRPQVKSIPNVGGKFSGVVESVLDDGVRVNIDCKRHGFVPTNHLSPLLSLGPALKQLLEVGDRIEDLMYVGGSNQEIFSRREALAMKTTKIPKLGNLHVGNRIRCSYHSSAEKGIFVKPLVQNCSEKLLISWKNIFNGAVKPDFQEHQSLIVKVQEIDHSKNKISLSLDSDDVFSQSVEDVINRFSQYISELNFLMEIGKKKGLDICDYKPGDQVMCKIDKIGSNGGCIVTLPNGARGISVQALCPKHLKNDEYISGTVISHDFQRQFVDICLKSDTCGKIHKFQNGQIELPFASGIAEKLLVKDECIIAVLKNSHCNKQLIYLPTKLHENDFEGCTSYYEAKRFKVCICGKIKTRLIGISKKLFLKLDAKISKSRNTDSVIKNDQIKEIPQAVNESFDKNDSIMVPVKDSIPVSIKDNTPTPMKDNISFPIKDKISAPIKDNAPVILPGVSCFFNSNGKRMDDGEISSEDEETGPKERKKKKISPVERQKLIKEEEEKMSRIEQELLDPAKYPESAPHFDRLLMAKPNSSELWIKYISFHIAATEIEKARAVSQRALETIDMTLPQEKFNIWIAVLNLELMFGTKETFDAVLEKAVKFNDSLQIYLKVIQMFAESGKYSEMDELIKKVQRKHKQDPTMWLEISKTLYQTLKFKDARAFKDKALKSITDKKTQLMLMVRFALMEYKFGEEDQGSAIFETILRSDPRKVNILITYVDQLIKKGHIEQARLILERSINQQLPLKSLKTVLTKFRKIEEQYGTPETLDNVRKYAQECLSKL